MNKYTAQVPIAFGGQDYKLEFDWAAISRIHSELGDDAMEKLYSHSPINIAKILAAGLAKNHPSVTCEQIMSANIPFMHVFKAIEPALMFFYWGPEGPPGASSEQDAEETSKKN